MPDGAGYDAIDKELAALVKERKLRDDDIDGRRALVRSWLNEHCRYSADAETPTTPDPLLYFLSETTRAAAHSLPRQRCCCAAWWGCPPDMW